MDTAQLLFWRVNGTKWSVVHRCDPTLWRIPHSPMRLQSCSTRRDGTHDGYPTGEIGKGMTTPASLPLVFQPPSHPAALSLPSPPLASSVDRRPSPTGTDALLSRSSATASQSSSSTPPPRPPIAARVPHSSHGVRLGTLHLPIPCRPSSRASDHGGTALRSLRGRLGVGRERSGAGAHGTRDLFRPFFPSAVVVCGDGA